MALSLQTYADLEAFVADNPPESVNLEYKSSKLLRKGEMQPVCKAVRYCIMLDMSARDALKFEHVFGVLGARHELQARYEKIPADLRERFEQVFKVDFKSDEA